MPVGWVGNDEPGRMLLACFREKGISTAGIFRIKGRSTVTKTRILAGMTHTSRQQVVRLDHEPATGIGAANSRRIAALARKYLRRSNALLISDYGYGAATPEIFAHLRESAAVNGIPVTLDSRYRMLAYTGVTAATPNEPEVEDALRVHIGSDTTQLFAAGRRLLQRMGLQSLLITRGRHGMTVFAKGRKPIELPIFGSDEIADVTGAGDTVIATFTAALAAGADPESAARLANYAGGIVVMKRGTATVTQRELLDAISKDLQARL
jgi:rfaE bifunctional protein kinase chain/domain